MNVGFGASKTSRFGDSKAKAGSGLTRPDDLILDGEYVQPAARGWPWYLIDHARTGGTAPIVPLEEASPLAPVIDGERVRLLGRDYYDKRVLDQLCDEHRNLSKCPPVTVLVDESFGRAAFSRRRREAVRRRFGRGRGLASTGGVSGVAVGAAARG